jgi:hypothetical protein
MLVQNLSPQPGLYRNADKAFAGAGYHTGFAPCGGINLPRRTRHDNVKHMSVGTAPGRPPFRPRAVSAAPTAMRLI